MEKISIVSEIHKNIMGTISFDLKCDFMRKAQEFIVYPIAKNDSAKTISIQSDNRFGQLSLETGKGVMSATHGSAGSTWLAFCMVKKTAKPFLVRNEDLTALKLAIFGSASENAGDQLLMTSDNSGASKVL